ncbi:MAG: hypothetical protein ABEJ57_00150 [Halobacteriaceae archaeon]
MNWASLVTALAVHSPVTADAAPTLDRALRVLDVDVRGTTLLEAATTILTIGAVLAVVTALLGDQRLALIVLVAAAGSAGGALLVPRWLATAHQTSALGDLPDLVGFAVLRMRIDPTPERAATFAARHARGPLATSLAEQVRHARGTPEDGWTAFGRTWRDDAPTLPRAIALLRAAGHAPAADRPRLLESALTVVLEGTKDRMATYATALRGPTTGLYAFGVVLPLATIGALPTLRAAGIPLEVTSLAILYDILLPAALALAGAWLVGRRPAAFPPAAVGATHPDLPARGRHLLLVVPATALLTTVVTVLVYPAWTPPLVVPAVTIGIALLTWTRPLTTIRERTRAIEAGIPAALTVVGQHLQRGAPPETAVADAATLLADPTGSVFGRAATIHDRLGVDLETAFLGEDGALANLPSPRLHAAATLLIVAGREGRHGGQVLIEVADHLDALTTVQQDARRELAGIVGTLRSTACCFAPIIGGATVALAARIGGAGLARSVTTVDTGALALVVGIYVLALGTILAALATALEHGLDAALLGEHVGYALVAAATIYPTTVLAAGWLV